MLLAEFVGSPQAQFTIYKTGNATALQTAPTSISATGFATIAGAGGPIAFAGTTDTISLGITVTGVGASFTASVGWSVQYG